MYQFDFVAIGIGHKGNHGAAAFDGAGLPGDLASGGANFFASGVGAVGGFAGRGRFFGDPPIAMENTVMQDRTLRARENSRVARFGGRLVLGA